MLVEEILCQTINYNCTRTSLSLDQFQVNLSINHKQFSITRNSLSLDQAGKDKDNAGNEPSFHGSQGLRLKKECFGPKYLLTNL